MATYCAPVSAPVATVWQMVERSVRRPQDFVPGVGACPLVEDGRDRVVRRIRMADGSAVVDVTEVLAIDTRGMRVVAGLVAHPRHDGTATTRVLPPGDAPGSHPALPTLSMTLDWRPRDAAATATDDAEALEGVAKIRVLYLKQAAEIVARRRDETQPAPRRS